MSHIIKTCMSETRTPSEHIMRSQCGENIIILTSLESSHPSLTPRWVQSPIIKLLTCSVPTFATATTNLCIGNTDKRSEKSLKNHIKITLWSLKKHLVRAKQRFAPKANKGRRRRRQKRRDNTEKQTSSQPAGTKDLHSDDDLRRKRGELVYMESGWWVTEMQVRSWRAKAGRSWCRKWP